MIVANWTDMIEKILTTHHLSLLSVPFHSKSNSFSVHRQVHFLSFRTSFVWYFSLSLLFFLRGFKSWHIQSLSIHTFSRELFLPVTFVSLFIALLHPSPFFFSSLLPSFLPFSSIPFPSNVNTSSCSIRFELYLFCWWYHCCTFVGSKSQKLVWVVKRVEGERKTKKEKERSFVHSFCQPFIDTDFWLKTLRGEKEKEIEREEEIKKEITVDNTPQTIIFTLFRRFYNPFFPYNICLYPFSFISFSLLLNRDMLFMLAKKSSKKVRKKRD